MRRAGYTAEEAQKACNTKAAKHLFNQVEQETKEFKKEKLIQEFTFFKEMLINLQDE